LLRLPASPISPSNKATSTAFVGSFESVAKDTLFTQTYRQVACNIKESVDKICAAVVLSSSIFDEAVMGTVATA
jgi:hypothetical protein